ncbi:MAG: copper transporter [Microthrixaceae bacterium]
MINLRFHIVSIVAVFLALSIGLFLGSSLLDRATIGVLKDRQRSLDTRNDALKSENAALRAGLETRDREVAAFGDEVLGRTMTPDLTAHAVTVLSVRGVDGGVVNRVVADLRAAGAIVRGHWWVEASMNLQAADTRTKVANELAGPGTAAAPARRSTAAVAAELGRMFGVMLDTAADEPSAVTTTAPATVVPGTDPVPPTTEAVPDAVTTAALQFTRLVESGMLTATDVGTAPVPADAVVPGTAVVLLGGEGAVLSTAQFVKPLAAAVAAKTPGLIVGEVRNPRGSADALTTNAPERGAYVRPLRTDPAIGRSVVTIDDVDDPIGRLALLLSVERWPNLRSGAFGTASDATSPLPPVK